MSGYPRLHPDDMISPTDPDYAPAIPRQRPIGRTPPPAQQIEELHFELRLEGNVIGTVYPMRLTGAAQLDLEDAKSTRDVIAWLKRYASADDATLASVEQTLRAGPLSGIRNFIQTVVEALTHAVDLSKPSGPRS